MATTSGQPLAAVRAGFAQEVRRFQPPGVLITEDMTKLLDTVARFIETGGTLTLEAKPDTPIGIDKLEYFRRPGPGPGRHAGPQRDAVAVAQAKVLVALSACEFIATRCHAAGSAALQSRSFFDSPIP